MANKYLEKIAAFNTQSVEHLSRRYDQLTRARQNLLGSIPSLNGNVLARKSVMGKVNRAGERGLNVLGEIRSRNTVWSI